MTQDPATASSLFGNIFYAVVLVAIGFWAARFVARLIKGLLERKELDQTLVGFVSNLANASILTVVAIAALNQLGIHTTSLVAIVGAAGLAIGLALKDSLGNFAAGIMILLFKQFKAGDFIEAAGVMGIVESLNMFSTQLKTGDNKTIFIPNGRLLNESITNYSMKRTRRVDLVVGVSYNTDLNHVKAVLADLLSQDERILKDPEPTIGVFELAERSIKFVIRPWVKSENYWPVYFDLNEAMKSRLDQEGVSIPYPQRDVYLHQTDKV